MINPNETDPIKIGEEQLKFLIEERDKLNNSISILKNQLRVEKIKRCKGILQYQGDLRDDYVYVCNICKNTHIFNLEPENLKCCKNI